MIWSASRRIWTICSFMNSRLVRMRGPGSGVNSAVSYRGRLLWCPRCSDGLDGVLGGPAIVQRVDIGGGRHLDRLTGQRNLFGAQTFQHRSVLVEHLGLDFEDLVDSASAEVAVGCHRPED